MTTAEPAARWRLNCISFATQRCWLDRECMASAVNIAHVILMRCDSREIASYVHRRIIRALLGAIGRGSGAVRGQFVGLCPEFGLQGAFP